MQETSEFWRHRRFRDLGLLRARFTRHRYDLHTHSSYVVALITDGCERIRIGRQTIAAASGMVALVNPEETHDGEAGADNGWAYRTLYPSVSLLTDVARELGREAPPLFPRALVADDHLARLLRAAHDGSRSDDATGAETSMLVALRHLILRHGDWGTRPEQVARSGSRQRVSLYRAVIEDNLADELDLQRLADAGGVTRFQVIRDFKKESGLTPAAFIRDRRVRRASALIEQGAGLADAAFAAGFADQSHLSRAFRTVHGITPGMFRRAC